MGQHCTTVSYSTLVEWVIGYCQKADSVSGYKYKDKIVWADWVNDGDISGAETYEFKGKTGKPPEGDVPHNFSGVSKIKVLGAYAPAASDISLCVNGFYDARGIVKAWFHEAEPLDYEYRPFGAYIGENATTIPATKLRLSNMDIGKGEVLTYYDNDVDDFIFGKVGTAQNDAGEDTYTVLQDKDGEIKVYPMNNISAAPEVVTAHRMIWRSWKDMNPIVILVDILLEHLQIPVDNLDLSSFRYAALLCYVERITYSVLIDEAKSVEQWIKYLLKPIFGDLYYDYQTGKLKISLQRHIPDDISEEELNDLEIPVLDDDVVDDVVLKVGSWYDVPSKFVVKWTNLEENKVESFTKEDIALYQNNQLFKAEELDYTMITSKETADFMAKYATNIKAKPIKEVRFKLSAYTPLELSITNIIYLELESINLKGFYYITEFGSNKEEQPYIDVTAISIGLDSSLYFASEDTPMPSGVDFSISTLPVSDTEMIQLPDYVGLAGINPDKFFGIVNEYVLASNDEIIEKYYANKLEGKVWKKVELDRANIDIEHNQTAFNAKIQLDVSNIEPNSSLQYSCSESEFQQGRLQMYLNGVVYFIRKIYSNNGDWFIEGVLSPYRNTNIIEASDDNLGINVSGLTAYIRYATYSTKEMEVNLSGGYTKEYAARLANDYTTSEEVTQTVQMQYKYVPETYAYKANGKVYFQPLHSYAGNFDYRYEKASNYNYKLYDDNEIELTDLTLGIDDESGHYYFEGNDVANAVFIGVINPVTNILTRTPIEV